MATILIVDDEQPLRELLADVLECPSPGGSATSPCRN